jgi:predicted metallopeptidase
MSKLRITPPNVVAKEEISKESIALMPLLPLIMPAQVSATVFAKGVTAPNPVMTTRRFNVLYRKKIKKKERRFCVCVV